MKTKKADKSSFAGTRVDSEQVFKTRRSASLLPNPVLSECSFYINTYNGKQLIKGKILKTNTGQKFSIYETGQRDFGEEKYKPVVSVTCLKTGYSLATFKSEKEVVENLDWVDALLNSKRRKDKINKMRRRGLKFLNDLRNFR